MQPLQPIHGLGAGLGALQQGGHTGGESPQLLLLDLPAGPVGAVRARAPSGSSGLEGRYSPPAPPPGPPLPPAPPPGPRGPWRCPCPPVAPGLPEEALGSRREHPGPAAARARRGTRPKPPPMGGRYAAPAPGGRGGCCAKVPPGGRGSQRRGVTKIRAGGCKRTVRSALLLSAKGLSEVLCYYLQKDCPSALLLSPTSGA